MVTLDKDVVVIGGYRESGTSLEPLYLMNCLFFHCEWKLMSQELKFARQNFVAMLIPDELTDCGKNLKLNIYLYQYHTRYDNDMPSELLSLCIATF